MLLAVIWLPHVQVLASNGAAVSSLELKLKPGGGGKSLRYRNHRNSGGILNKEGLHAQNATPACFSLFLLSTLDTGSGREIPAICHGTGV